MHPARRAAQLIPAWTAAALYLRRRVADGAGHLSAWRVRAPREEGSPDMHRHLIGTALASAAAVPAVAVGATPVVAATAAWTVTVCRSSPASRLLAARLAARHGTGPQPAMLVLSVSENNAGMEMTVATFVLIHGGGDVGWYWHLVERELWRWGHDTVAPDLPCDDDSAGLTKYRRHRGECDRRPPRSGHSRAVLWRVHRAAGGRPGSRRAAGFGSRNDPAPGEAPDDWPAKHRI